jgi:hypothetical protein
VQEIKWLSFVDADGTPLLLDTGSGTVIAEGRSRGRCEILLPASDSLPVAVKADFQQLALLLGATVVPAPAGA